MNQYKCTINVLIFLLIPLLSGCKSDGNLKSVNQISSHEKSTVEIASKMENELGALVDLFYSTKSVNPLLNPKICTTSIGVDEPTEKLNTIGQDNWSGAHWNSKKDILWLVRNNHGIRSYKYKSSRWKVQNDIKINADLEGITQADFDSNKVFVIAEKKKEIRQYEILDNKIKSKSKPWKFKNIQKKEKEKEKTYNKNLVDFITKEKVNMEGIVFVPNNLLKNYKFTNDKGDLYKSPNFLKGIFLLSNQNNGIIYALDLKNNGDYDLIGKYILPTNETRGLEIDRSTGQLYFIDGFRSGKSKLSSSAIPNSYLRRFDLIQFSNGPGPKGVEGIAINSKDDWLFIVDDKNRAKDKAILWYKKCQNP